MFVLLLGIKYSRFQLGLVTCFARKLFVMFDLLVVGLQCFDAVGWAAGRASGL